MAQRAETVDVPGPRIKEEGSGKKVRGEEGKRVGEAETVRLIAIVSNLLNFLPA